jgi:hypothetical protein
LLSGAACGTSTTIVYATGDAAAVDGGGAPPDGSPSADGGPRDGGGDSAVVRRAACPDDVAFSAATPLAGIPKGSSDLRVSGDGLVVAYRTAVGLLVATRGSAGAPFPAGAPLANGPATGGIAWNSTGTYAVEVTADGRGLALRDRPNASGVLGAPSEAAFTEFNAYQRGIPAERSIESPAMTLATTLFSPPGDSPDRRTRFSVTEGSRFGRSLLVFATVPGGGYAPRDPNEDPAAFGALRITDWTDDGTVAAVDPGADDPDQARFLAIGVDGLRTRVPLPATIHDVSIADDCSALFGLVGDAENAEAVRLPRK